MSRRKKTYPKLTVFLLCLVVYVALKCFINNEPIVSWQPTLSIGIFNYKPKIVYSPHSTDSKIDPVIMRSAYQTNLQAPNPMPPYSSVKGQPIYVLGTDHLGRDVLAGWINGLEIALLIGIGTGLLSGLLSLLIAAINVWLEKYPIYLPQYTKIILFALGILGILNLSWALMGMSAYWWGCMLIALLIIIIIVICKRTYSGNAYVLSLSNINRLALEALQPIPDLLIIILLASLLPHAGIASIIILLAILRLPFNTWFLEGAGRQQINALHITQAKAMGFTFVRLFGNHLLPFMRSSLGMVIATTAIRAIMAESILSFFGIGPTGSYITWGSMIKLGLTNLSMWWVSLFPILGLTILGFMLQRLSKSSVN